MSSLINFDTTDNCGIYRIHPINTENGVFYQVVETGELLSKNQITALMRIGYQFLPKYKQF